MKPARASSSPLRPGFRAPACATSAAAAALATAVAQAHPGHSIFQSSPIHLLTEPDHATVLVAVGVVLWLIGSAFRRPGLRHATRLIGAAALSSGLLLVLAAPAH